MCEEFKSTTYQGPNGAFRTVKVGDGFKVAECFGAHRISKKLFRTEDAAKDRAVSLAGITS